MRPRRAGPARRLAGPDDPWRRVQLGVLLLVIALAGGTAGYVVLGLGVLDALYQTVTTVSTVGFREVDLEEVDTAWKIFTMVVVLAGVGTALYTLSVFFEALVEGRLTDRIGRRRMERRIDGMKGQVIVCGWGRVGRSVAAHVGGLGADVVVVDRDPERVASVPFPVIEGDATDDEVLERAGIDRARTLISALDADADNLYVTLSGRSRRPDLFIVARARVDSAESKLLQAGANRVVNPQRIGGARMAALALQPDVADFMDVVMHDGSLEFRLADVRLAERSELAGKTIRDAHVRDRTGAMVLAIRQADGSFLTNPEPDTDLAGGAVLIAVGTEEQLDELRSIAGQR